MHRVVQLALLINQSNLTVYAYNVYVRIFRKLFLRWHFGLSV